MGLEAVAAAAVAPAAPPATLAGYGANLGDMTAAGARFDAALARAGGPATAAPVTPPRAPDSADAVSPALKGMFSALEKVNGQAREVGKFAQDAMAQGRDLTPGEIVQLTMRCHEFMFHCQLSSSIANRTSDGVQQLFKQQA
ncbi:MAG: hypothetical protein DCF31_10505 [Alphaproteobacteria bacterium]|nr:MAG: hypothetical protein DCF31_10505 [Alphaproteobacteria bacterium]